MRLRQLLPAGLRVWVNTLEEDAQNVRRVRSEVRRPPVISRHPIEPVKFNSETPVKAAPVRKTEVPGERVIVFSETGMEVRLRDEETILFAALRQGVELAYSCTLGGCGACMLRLIEGEVEYEDRESVCLTDEEIESGYFLACLGRPVGTIKVEA